MMIKYQNKASIVMFQECKGERLSYNLIVLYDYFDKVKYPYLFLQTILPKNPPHLIMPAELYRREKKPQLSRFSPTALGSECKTSISFQYGYETQSPNLTGKPLVVV